MSPILGIIASGANVSSTAFESIASATGTGSSNTITFSSIPGTYQHLQIRYIGKSTNTATSSYNLLITFNSDTGTNYTRHAMRGNGATVAATGTASTTSISTVYDTILSSGSAISDMFGVGIIDIHDYTSTSKNKTVRIFSGADTNRTTAPTGIIALSSGVWMSTSAITSITLEVTSSNWTTTSTFALYGVKGA